MENLVLIDGSEALPRVRDVAAAPGAADASGSLRWFAAYTSPRHEKRVSQHMDLRQIQHFLPVYRTLRRWNNGCKVTIELPLFPNYIFVRIPERQRVSVLEVPGVVSMVGSGRELLPLPDFEIAALRSGLEQRKVEPHPYLITGERARIKSGPFAGMEGVLVRKKNDLRVVLTLEQIMRSVVVEIDGDEVEPVLGQRSRTIS